mmetsp:Transcript_106793/g.298946  ORF Transcript_106793/g.298946 Transcript_106793/m.298946 type:complete len:280 (+) Transcript_106793:127-966(+)
MKFSFAILCVTLASANGFAIVGRQAIRWNSRATTTNTALFYAAPEMETMKLREIQAELKDLGVPFGDCFDRDSLLCRLRDAREGKIETKPSAAAAAAASDEKASTDSAKPTVQLDADVILADLRSQPLKELKIQCSQRNLRYATFLEKEDFVQAIWKDMQAVASFSVSGALRPGKVSDITGEQLDGEISSYETPILLDVYATWCGPCKMMAPEMDKVAEELGSKCRVAKLDSDKHPEWAARYKVQGLPTTLLIHKGQVQGRLEGAFMKDKLLELAQPHI